MNFRPPHTFIGLSGTNGAGKDTVAGLLAAEHGFLFISVTEALRDELRRRGLPVDREHLRALSAEWRREFGLGVLVDRAVQRYDKLPIGAYKGLVIASLRNPAEADRVHELGGVVAWIDADPKVRFARIRANAASRDRAGEDDKTFEQFLAEEKAEMYRSGDEATLDMSGVKALADMTLMNDTADHDQLAKQVIETFI